MQLLGKDVETGSGLRGITSWSLSQLNDVAKTKNVAFKYSNSGKNALMFQVIETRLDRVLDTNTIEEAVSNKGI